MNSVRSLFSDIRNQIIGIDETFETPFGRQKIVYADWIASGRRFQPIEDKMQYDFGPFIANTHTESSETGIRMTRSYHYSHEYIKKHVNAGPNDVIITAGTGMTTVINKLQRILSLKCHRKYFKKEQLPEEERPVVFVTHMEHHSNHTSWYETMADVVMLEPGKDLEVDPEELKNQLKIYSNRKYKIGAFTACSNVTGVFTPYHALAGIMHENHGLCFVDFAASAPYVDINMHPDDPLEKLDAIYFSPHKFLGGPGSPGVLVFDSSMYDLDAPDCPGGGTVDWTNPWGKYKYVDNIEVREDGGTPGFLQSIRAAMAIKLKEKMGVENIALVEKELIQEAFKGLQSIPGIKILAENHLERLGIFSFYHPEVHFNLMVKILSDKFGIQMRGGCACAGTYGHYLLKVTHDKSTEITDRINHGDLSVKPGWVRWSLHPTTIFQEVYYILEAINDIVTNRNKYRKLYNYNSKVNEFYHIDAGKYNFDPEVWFDL